MALDLSKDFFKILEEEEEVEDTFFTLVVKGQLPRPTREMLLERI